MRIVVKNACKRKAGFLYSIDSDGNLVETKGTSKPPGPGSPQHRLTNCACAQDHCPDSEDITDADEDLWQGSMLPRTPLLSYNDTEKRAAHIRNQTLRRLIKIYGVTHTNKVCAVVATTKINAAFVMKELNVSRRTAYDYINTIKILRGKI